jgi:hypothetical protein
MSKPRPWWETHPKKYWQAEDWKAARAAGVVPPLPSSYVDPAKRLAYEATPKVASIGGLYQEPDREGERRRKVDAALEDAGVRPRRGW